MLNGALFNGFLPNAPSGADVREIRSLHGFEVGLGFCESLHGFRVGIFNEVNSLHGFEVGLGFCRSLHGFRVGMGSQVQSLHGFRVEFGVLVDPGDGTGDDTPTPPMDLSSWQAAIRQTNEDVLDLLFKRYTVTLTLVSVTAAMSWDLTPYLLTYSVTQHRNDPCQWNFTLADTAFRFIPWGGDLAPYINGANIDSTYAVKNYLVFKISENGRTPWESPRLIQTRKMWDFSGDVPKVTLVGTDYSKLLLGKNLQMDDFVSSPAHVYTAKEIITTILSHFNIGFASLEFTDFNVPRFPPKGSTPLDWIKALLWVKQAEWAWDRDTFRAFPRYSSGLQIVRDIYHMRNVGFEESSDDLLNEFVIKKTANVSDVLASFEFFTPDVPGFVGGESGISFTPSRHAQIVIEDIVFGSVDNVVWWNEYGPVSTMPGLGPYIGAIPVSKVVMTYTPGTPFPPVKAHIKGMIIGEPLSADFYPPGTEKAFTVTVKNATNQDEYGIARDQTPQDATFVPNRATAQELGEALIDESKRNMLQCSWEGILFPTLVPSMQVNIWATIAGSMGRAHYVESVTKSGTKDQHMMSVQTTHFA